MLRVAIVALACSAAAWGAEPVLDNDRVIVWDTTQALPPAQHDFVAIALSRKGTARFGRQGALPSHAGIRTIVIEVKDHTLPPLANTSGYPLAFPRPHARKLFENAKVVVWDYTWRPHDPTPMHFHDKDAVAVFEGTGALQSTTPDGKSTTNEIKFGDIRFNGRDRAHSELLVRGSGRAVITELK